MQTIEIINQLGSIRMYIGQAQTFDIYQDNILVTIIEEPLKKRQFEVISNPISWNWKVSSNFLCVAFGCRGIFVIEETKTIPYIGI